MRGFDSRSGLHSCFLSQTLYNDRVYLMKDNGELKKQASLFEQTKDMVIYGDRLSGEPEILHEVQDLVTAGVSRPQIQEILEAVPSVFPENWQSPDSYSKLTFEQKKAYVRIAKIGPFRLIGPEIQEIIETAIEVRDKPKE